MYKLATEFRVQYECLADVLTNVFLRLLANTFKGNDWFGLLPEMIQYKLI